MTSRKFREGLNLSAVGFMLLLLSGAWLIFPSVTLAQKSTAAINGTVTDPSGAVIPQATVRLRNVLTGVERSTVTNETGSYVFVDVLPGRYTLKVTKEGFSTATQPEFEMYVNQTATFDGGAWDGHHHSLGPRPSFERAELYPVIAAHSGGQSVQRRSKSMGWRRRLRRQGDRHLHFSLGARPAQSQQPFLDGRTE